jgi:GGDEF domain-containing protein
MARIKKNLKKKTIVLIAFSFAILSFLTLIIFHNFQENHNFENHFLNFNKSIITFSAMEIAIVFLLTAILVFLLSYVLIKTDTLERIVNLDELTKVLTRRSFFFYNADGNRKRDGIILLVDIDYFKSINDTFGHDIGDYYLQKIGKELKKNCKK